MAYAALVSLSQTVDLFLNYHHNAITPQVKDQIISINEYAVFLQEFLQHFKDKANHLEALIGAVTRVVEDIIEFFMSKHILHEPCYARSRYDFHDLNEAADEIKSIAEMVMKIKDQMAVKVKSNDDSCAVNSSLSSSSSSRVASVYKDVMVGSETAKMEIKSLLCGESSKLEFIPIVGMGGIGKTTLARNVHDDPLTVEHFQIREWVTVSQDYILEDIISNLLVSMNVFLPKDKPMEAKHVYQHLKCRRYLIVLDDVWSAEAWDDLKWMFPDDDNGSRIIMTTRLSGVATYLDPYSAVHEMQLLNEDQSWKLLQQEVFKKEQCPIELEDSGKLIARNCRGLPLAIVVISGILSSIDHTAFAWDDIAKNVTARISADNEQFDKILTLSYTHLPQHLRPCFLYMGRFQEDYEVRTSRLIKLWIAEGFLKPGAGNNSSEETAEEYLEDLIKRRLFVVSNRKSDGRVKSFGMHDLVWEMCRRKSHSVNMKIRTYATTRVLDLGGGDTPRLTELERFHLRYLAFNGSFSILSHFQNLQTLVIPNPYSDVLLYNESDHEPLLLIIYSMPQLRHLVIGSGFCFSLPPNYHPRAKFRLGNLQTLTRAINFICTPEILEMIPDLKKLKISYTAFRDDEEDYLLHNLVHLQHLENLKLNIHKDFPFREKVNPVFPITLKKLSLRGVQLPWEDMKIVGSLPNLEVLKLRNDACNGYTWETNEEEFSELRFLLIDGSDLQEWITESSHFPKLVRLVLYRCRDLTRIPNEIGDVAALELIEVDDDDLFESAKQIQEDQQSYGNESLQIRLVERKDIFT